MLLSRMPMDAGREVVAKGAWPGIIKERHATFARTAVTVQLHISSRAPDGQIRAAPQLNAAGAAGTRHEDFDLDQLWRIPA
jgi:hypothetical protein